MADKIVECYEQANDLVKSGDPEAAIEKYREGLSILRTSNSPDVSTRTTYFVEKLAQLCFKLGRYEEARTYYDIMGVKMPTPPTSIQPFKQAIKTLQQHGLLRSLSNEQINIILQEEMDVDLESADDEIDVLQFLQLYYSPFADVLSPSAIEDGFLTHDWRFGQETDDVVSELCQLVGRPLFRQIGYHEEARTDSAGTINLLTVEAENGERSSFPVLGLDDVVAFFNQALERLDDARRFVSIDTQADFHAYYLLDVPKYKGVFGGETSALVEEEIVGVDGARWMNSQSSRK
jgi:tetratricopeptide (TPR) repeat protein